MSTYRVLRGRADRKSAGASEVTANSLRAELTGASLLILALSLLGLSLCVRGLRSGHLDVILLLFVVGYDSTIDFLSQ